MGSACCCEAPTVVYPRQKSLRGGGGIKRPSSFRKSSTTTSTTTTQQRNESTNIKEIPIDGDTTSVAAVMMPSVPFQRRAEEAERPHPLRRPPHLDAAIINSDPQHNNVLSPPREASSPVEIPRSAVMPRTTLAPDNTNINSWQVEGIRMTPLRHILNRCNCLVGNNQWRVRSAHCTPLAAVSVVTMPHLLSSQRCRHLFSVVQVSQLHNDPAVLRIR